MNKDALAAHARDELGITEVPSTNPIQAALTSAATFTAGAALPLLAAWLTGGQATVLAVALTSLAVLALLVAFWCRHAAAA